MSPQDRERHPTDRRVLVRFVLVCLALVVLIALVAFAWCQHQMTKAEFW